MWLWVVELHILDNFHSVFLFFYHFLICCKSISTMRVRNKQTRIVHIMVDVYLQVGVFQPHGHSLTSPERKLLQTSNLITNVASSQAPFTWSQEMRYLSNSGYELMKVN